MPNVELFPLVDRLMAGRFAERLQQWREEDRLSYAAISRRIYVEYQIEVSYQTIARWCQEFGFKKGAAA